MNGVCVRGYAPPWIFTCLFAVSMLCIMHEHRIQSNPLREAGTIQKVISTRTPLHRITMWCRHKDSTSNYLMRYISQAFTRRARKTEHRNEWNDAIQSILHSPSASARHSTLSLLDYLVCMRIFATFLVVAFLLLGNNIKMVAHRQWKTCRE